MSIKSITNPLLTLSIKFPKLPKIKNVYGQKLFILSLLKIKKEIIPNIIKILNTNTIFLTPILKAPPKFFVYVILIILGINVIFLFKK